jgi:hypothetical protein
MSGIETSLAYAPSVREWIERAGQAVAAGDSVFLAFPATVACDPVLDAAARAAEGRGCTVAEIDLSRMDVRLPPLIALGTALGFEPAAVASIGALVAAPGAPDVVVAREFGCLPAEPACRWVRLVEQVARASTAQPARGPAFLLAAGGLVTISCLPRSTTDVRVQWWHGFPSATELRLACREGAAESSHPARQLWREHVLCSIAGNDATLAVMLWDAVFESTAAIDRVLQEYASKVGWTPAALEQAGVRDFRPAPLLRRSPEPPGQRELWAIGALSQTEEFGLELHSAAAATLGLSALWQQRIWRAQLAFALPLLEDIRVRLCERLCGTWGSTWPFRWEPPDSEEERREAEASALAESWGFLAHLYRNVPALARDSRIVSLVVRGHYLRNELSHSRTILFPDFKALYEQAAELVWSR